MFGWSRTQWKLSMWLSWHPKIGLQYGNTRQERRIFGRYRGAFLNIFPWTNPVIHLKHRQQEKTRTYKNLVNHKKMRDSKSISKNRTHGKHSHRCGKPMAKPVWNMVCFHGGFSTCRRLPEVNDKLHLHRIFPFVPIYIISWLYPIFFRLYFAIFSILNILKPTRVSRRLNIQWKICTYLCI